LLRTSRDLTKQTPAFTVVQWISLPVGLVRFGVRLNLREIRTELKTGGQLPGAAMALATPPCDLESLMKLLTALLIGTVMGIVPALAQTTTSTTTTTTRTSDGGTRTTITSSDGSSTTTTTTGSTSTTTYEPPGSGYQPIGASGYDPMGHK
jgi:hypothetical protein